MKSYIHLFFDLDGTLWDFERNSADTLRELYHELNLPTLGVPGFDTFIEDYHQINDTLWAAYKKQEISKETLSVGRFSQTLALYHIKNDELAQKIARDYVDRSPTKTHLLPGAKEVLEELVTQYSLHVITNGFSEIQNRKLQLSGLNPYFQTLITSDEAGVNKPHRGIFDYALRKTGALASESLMIGDDPEADIEGARLAGMAQLFVNLKNRPAITTPTHEVHNLYETLQLLSPSGS